MTITPEDKSGFRRTLHEWARQQLDRTTHVGPFEITGVEMEQTTGSSISDSETWVHIYFTHEGSNCDPSWRRTYVSGSGTTVQDRCIDTTWFMPDTRRTVDMLNELLAIAAVSS